MHYDRTSTLGTSGQRAIDTTYVAAGTPHRFRNASATEPMRILWIHASVDATRTLVENGVTTRVDAEYNKAAVHRG